MIQTLKKLIFLSTVLLTTNNIAYGSYCEEFDYSLKNQMRLRTIQSVDQSKHQKLETVALTEYCSDTQQESIQNIMLHYQKKGQSINITPIVDWLSQFKTNDESFSQNARNIGIKDSEVIYHLRNLCIKN